MASYSEINTELKLLTLFDVRERLQNLASTSLLVSFSVYKRNRFKHIQQLSYPKNKLLLSRRIKTQLPIIKGCIYKLQ